MEHYSDVCSSICMHYNKWFEVKHIVQLSIILLGSLERHTEVVCLTQFTEAFICKQGNSSYNCSSTHGSYGLTDPIETMMHDDVIKWEHFPLYWPFVWGIHRPPVNSPHKGQWRGALMFSLIYLWINSWINNHEAGDLRCYHAHYDVIVMCMCIKNMHASLYIHISCMSGAMRQNHNEYSCKLYSYFVGWCCI